MIDTVCERPGGPSAEAGFSLAEMLIAVTVTLIVSGAVYGLLVSGENSFRREPALADRQDQIRNAMQNISADLIEAGAGMSPWSQIFQRGQTGLGPLGASAAGNSDFLEILTTDRSCPSMTVALHAGTVLNILEAPPACWTIPAGAWAPIYVSGPAGPATAINLPTTPGGLLYGTQPGALGSLTFPAGKPFNGAGVLCTPDGDAGDCTRIAKVQYVLYEIQPDIDGVPSLWRSATGGLNPTTGAAVAAGPGAAGWQLVARGIDDLRVTYSAGNPPAFTAQPPLVILNTATTIVRSVQVLLSSETTSQANLQGATSAAAVGGAGAVAIHGQLQTVVSPRAALVWLSQLPPPLWN